MMDKYTNKNIVYGGKNYINSIIELTHLERDKLEYIRKKLKCKTINAAIQKLIKQAIKEAE